MTPKLPTTSPQVSLAAPCTIQYRPFQGTRRRTQTAGTPAPINPSEVEPGQATTARHRTGYVCTCASSFSALASASLCLAMSFSISDGSFFHRCTLLFFASGWLALGMGGRGVACTAPGATASGSSTCIRPFNHAFIHSFILRQRCGVGGCHEPIQQQSTVRAPSEHSCVPRSSQAALCAVKKKRGVVWCCLRRCLERSPHTTCSSLRTTTGTASCRVLPYLFT